MISTTIPYVNPKPHIGHALEFVLADAVARYYRKLEKQVLLQSGTDDNATKNVLSARAEGWQERLEVSYCLLARAPALG